MQKLAITPGEPAGIGPELLVRYCQQKNDDTTRLIAVASKALLEYTASELKLPITLLDFEPDNEQPQVNGVLDVVDIALADTVVPGTLNPANASYVLQTLHSAVDMCLAHNVDALVTGPVQKSVINDAGYAFSGHTEFLAERAQCKTVVMMLATEGLRVALATTHLPLKEVANAITERSLEAILHILDNDLRLFFGLEHPRILVCGLNPHAGESGHLGSEEIEVITPVLRRLKRTGMQLTGPLPADTLFTPRHLENADAVLAMYHDQGLPVLKYKGFGNAVNITLGLPFIRTSVDHGTALDLVGQHTADIGSLATAIDYAKHMTSLRQAHANANR